MSKYYLGINHHKMNQKNPFIDEMFEMEVSTRTKIVAGNREAMNNLVIDTKSGEVVAHQMLAVKQKVDKDQFTKIFHKGLAAMWGLSNSGIRVFTFVAQLVKPNQDFIYFNLDEAKEFTEYKSKKSIMQGMGQLLTAGFIARSNVHYKYFINPTFFFNGSRLTLISHYEIDPNLNKNETTLNEGEQASKFLLNQMKVKLD